jgi:hypothetical protein
MAVTSSAMQAALYFNRKRQRARAARIQEHGSLLVEEGADNGTVVGTLSMIPQFGRTAYEMTDDAGGRFAILGNAIVVANGAALVFATNDSHDIVVKATDPSRNTFTKTLTIEVTEAP